MSEVLWLLGGLSLTKGPETHSDPVIDLTTGVRINTHTSWPHPKAVPLQSRSPVCVCVCDRDSFQSPTTFTGGQTYVLHDSITLQCVFVTLRETHTLTGPESKPNTPNGADSRRLPPHPFRLTDTTTK